MPEHVHLLISEPKLHALADAIKSLKQGVARRSIGDGEHFWQKRYYDFNVRNHRQFAEKWRYIHRNPVKRGLCERPEDWEWSSFRQYATGCEGRVQIESEWAVRKRERAAGRLSPAVELDGWPTLDCRAGCPILWTGGPPFRRTPRGIWVPHPLRNFCCGAKGGISRIPRHAQGATQDLRRRRLSFHHL